MSLIIHPVSSGELDRCIPELTPLLIDTVNYGVPLGFIPPISAEESRRYWQGLRGDLQSGVRVLLIAIDGGRMVGSGQLAYSAAPNGRHRCEIQKLFVDPSSRGKGVGRALMDELHQAARRTGRTLVFLQTRRGIPAVQFYLALGYREAGMIPGFSIDADGRRYDSLTFYLELPRL